MKDIMLDLETFGTSHNAVIVQIGACYFDRNTGEIGEKILLNIDADDSVRNGFEIDGRTVYWWLNQSDEARKSILADGLLLKVKPALSEFNDFVKGSNNRIWSHATFDFVILMNHFNRTNTNTKIHYRQARDLRTLVDIAKVKYKKEERTGVHHNALDDCLFQVKYCVACLKKVGENVST